MELLKTMFNGLLSSIVNGYNHIKYVSLINQKCMIQPTLINLDLNEYRQEFHHHLFAVKLLEVLILLMTYLIKYVFQIKKKIKLHMC